ncbi:MAG: hypothetical protein JSW29_07135 [Candidatus Bathyarchaeota archaeon]|nr:MAG: hypothetical protein JSW29_07135 [Candidatus Bathyarchaeota archaeon]
MYSAEELILPKLKLKVEDVIRRYLTVQITDEEFKESIQSILEEFEGKRLLHQNIGQLTWQWEKRTPLLKSRFTKIWILLEQVIPQIISDFNRRMKENKSSKST